MTEQVGNPYFGKNDTTAYKEACEEDIETRTKRMNELHHSDYKFPSKSRKTKSRK